MIVTGKAICYGDNINTDLIIAGKYTKTLDMDSLASHAMEDLDPDFNKKVKDCPVIAAGENFGCGSSREQAPLALKYAGVKALLAKSFARIFFRNAINIGLIVAVIDTESIDQQDLLSCDTQKGEVFIKNKNIYLPTKPLPQIMEEISKAGGLACYLKEKGDFI